MSLLNNVPNEDVRAESVLAKLDKTEATAAAMAPASAEGDATHPSAATPAADPAASETALSGEGKGHSEPVVPAIEPPATWKAELKDRWGKLPTDLQRDLAQWETERNTGVNQKLSEAAEARKQLDTFRKEHEGNISAAAQERQRYAQTLALVAQQMEMLDPVIATYNRTDLVKLAQENPAEYAQLDAAYKARMGALQAVRAEQAQAQNAAMQDHFQREERALLEKWSDLAKPEVGHKTLNDLRQGVVASYGFKPDEVRIISDHRYVLMARDALEAPKLREEVATLKTQLAERDKAAQAAIQAKRVTSTQPVLKPNPSEETRAGTSSERNKAILNKARGTRSLSDKASLIASMLD